MSKPVSEAMKKEAVRRVLAYGKKASVVAKEMGLERWEVERWVEKATAPPGELSDEREELERLRREKKQLEMENEILSKEADYLRKRGH